jgi:ABC-type phosphate transport system substrate-binding protein
MRTTALKILRPILFLLLALLLSPCVSVVAAEEYVFVVHQESEIDSVSARELRRIFLGKTKKWPDGTAALPVLNPSALVHADFSRQVLHKSPNQLTTYWRKNLYSGRSMMPYSAIDVVDLTNYLTRHKNAISYLSKSDLNGPLKIVRVTK